MKNTQINSNTNHLIPKVGHFQPSRHISRGLHEDPHLLKSKKQIR